MKGNFIALLSLFAVHTIHCVLELQSLDVENGGLAEVGVSLISGKGIVFQVKSQSYYGLSYLNVTLFKSEHERIIKKVGINTDRWYFSEAKFFISPTAPINIQFCIVNIYSPENNYRRVLADGEDHFVVNGKFNYLYQSQHYTKMKFENYNGNAPSYSPYTCDPVISNGYPHSTKLSMRQNYSYGFQSELNQVFISGDKNFNQQSYNGPEYLPELGCLYSIKWSVSTPSYYGMTRQGSIHTKASDEGFQILFSSNNGIHSVMMFPYEAPANYKKHAYDQETGITTIRSDIRTLDHYLAMFNTAKACWVSTWWEGGDVKSSVSCQQL